MDHMHNKRFTDRYQVALQRSLLLERTVPTFPNLEGPDPFDNIKLMSTNDILQVEIGEVHNFKI
jgi:hypothetical protein